MPIDYNKVIENKTIDIKNKYSNDPQKNYENDNNNKGLKDPNHIKIIPSSGVIYKKTKKKKERNEK